VAIQGFKCAETQKLFETDRSQKFGSIRKIATRKLQLLDAATTLSDLESPPGNRLEALTRDKAGQHSVRINAQWRICFVWTESGPAYVEITNHYQEE
jgi:toxin HigB-1